MLDALAFTYAAITVVTVLGLQRRSRSSTEDDEREERVFSSKLTSIEEGERNAVGVLARIAAARTTPDRQRARALELLAARAGDEVLGEVLKAVLRRCEPASRRAVFSLAHRFPDPELLETAALESLQRAREVPLVVAALEAMAVVGGPRSLSALRKRRWHTPELKSAAERAEQALKTKPPLDQEGALSDPQRETGAMSLRG